MFFFDMDGVLTDSNGIWKKVDREFLARRGMKYTHAYYEGVAHVPLPLAAAFTKEFCKLPESCEAIVAEWMELAAGSYAHVPVKPGVRAYLKQCKSEGRRMAVVTSSVPEHCHMALEALGLEKYFERVTFAQELGLEKRKPEVRQGRRGPSGGLHRLRRQPGRLPGGQGGPHAGGGGLRRSLRPGRDGDAGLLRRVYQEL